MKDDAFPNGEKEEYVQLPFDDRATAIFSGSDFDQLTSECNAESKALAMYFENRFTYVLISYFGCNLHNQKFFID